MSRAVFYEVTPNERPTLEALMKGEQALYTDKLLTRETAGLAAGAAVVSVFIVSQVNAGVLGALPDVRLIATRSTGYDHIDLDACRSRNVIVANVPSYGSNTVAEHTFGLILALSRRIAVTFQRVRLGEFSREGLCGFDLRGKTLGVIGTGRIGSHVIRIGKAFGMNVIAHDGHPDERLSAAMDFGYVPLDDLLTRSHVVSLHCPYTPESHHLINEKSLARMQKGTLLINTARGGLVDTRALLGALRSGHLGGAGLDVLEEEKSIFEEREVLADSYDREKLELLVQNHALLKLPNVIITPHNAFNSEEALHRILETTVSNIHACLAGTPANVVNG